MQKWILLWIKSNNAIKLNGLCLILFQVLYYYAKQKCVVMHLISTELREFDLSLVIYRLLSHLNDHSIFVSWHGSWSLDIIHRNVFLCDFSSNGCIHSLFKMTLKDHMNCKGITRVFSSLNSGFRIDVLRYLNENFIYVK